MTHRVFFAGLVCGLALLCSPRPLGGGIFYATANVYLLRDHKAGDVVECSGTANGGNDPTPWIQYHIRSCNERVRR